MTYSKETSTGRQKKQKPLYYCSDGEKVTQSVINSRLTKAYKDNHMSHFCECCGNKKAIHHDHTISQRKCKELHKTELIWSRLNWSDSCLSCHMAWESYKSGLFENHLNMIERMLFVKKHDPENFGLRLLFISDVNYR